MTLIKAKRKEFIVAINPKDQYILFGLELEKESSYECTLTFQLNNV
jgi:hypothetical protein